MTCPDGPAAVSANLGEFGLAPQFRPHLVHGGGSRCDHFDPALGVALGLGVPDVLHLQQAPVTATQVVLAEVERRPPASTLEFTAILGLQDCAVLALTCQPLPGCRECSGDHATIVNEAPCGASVPIACEFRTDRWGQTGRSCAPLVWQLWAADRDDAERAVLTAAARTPRRRAPHWRTSGRSDRSRRAAPRRSGRRGCRRR